jgi:Tfp pilus assembly PilM family ATPase/Tfp pilus assembly protein PilN
MLRDSLSVTGLEISQQHLRVVELRETAEGIVLERVGAIATPPGAVAGGYIVDAAAISTAVRTLYESHGIKSRLVIIGAPASQVASRISRVPTVAPPEMRSLAQGEVEHYRLLPPGGETFDFVVMSSEGNGDGSSERTTDVLLMAIDERIADTYAQVVKSADLLLLSLEPTPIACLRALYPYLLRQPTTALVAVGDHSTALSIVRNGALSYYRTLEAGTLRLGESPSQVEELVQELRRSLEFYHRERRPEETVSLIQLVIDATQFRNFDHYLSAELGIPVEVRHPFAGIRCDPSRFAADFLLEVGPSFTTAFGLALREMDDAFVLKLAADEGAAVGLEQLPELPRIDLSTREREKRTQRAQRQRLFLSAGISILLVLVCALASTVINAQTAVQRRALAQVEEQLNKVNQEIVQQQAVLDQVFTAMTKARAKGTSPSRLLLQLSSAMPPNVWLTAFSTEPDGNLKVEGRAMSPFLVAATLRRLSQSNRTLAPKLVSMRGEKMGAGNVFIFEIRLQPPRRVVRATG